MVHSVSRPWQRLNPFECSTLVPCVMFALQCNVLQLLEHWRLTRLVTMSCGHSRELTTSAMGHTGTSGSSVQLLGGHADAKASTKDRTTSVIPGRWRNFGCIGYTI